MYDINKDPGNRVVSLDVLCLNCTVPEYFPLDDNAIYNVLAIDFTINGGDNYTVLKEKNLMHLKISKQI